MKKGIRTAVYDTALQLEVFRFQGIAQPFPSHFHAYYVIGLIEKGRRSLSCRNTVYSLRPGNIVLFNPGDTHACVQSDETAMDYRGLNIPRETMLTLAEAITGKRALPAFSHAVIADKEAARCLRRLHEAVMGKACTLHREELLLLLISLLLPYCSCPFEAHTPECRAEIEAACRFMELHFAEHICLKDICLCAAVSKSTLLRAFTKSKGLTPYGYLESVRIGAAKRLLEQGVSPVDTALQVGFSDQSHFTNCFSRFIGLSPGLYQDSFRRQESRKPPFSM